MPARGRVAHILVCHSLLPTKLISSIPRHRGELWFVYFHGSDKSLSNRVASLVDSLDGNFFPYGENRGLAASWNEGMHLSMQFGCTSTILLNDDMFFYEGGYESFLETIERQRRATREVSFVSLHGLESGGSPYAGQIVPQSFACCAITADAIERVGYFDENFKPAYFEDVDYARRAALEGMHAHIDERTLVEHERSLTTRTNKELGETSSEHFQRNKDYFSSKWGGTDGAEHYTKPFNNVSFTNKIPFYRRNNPYQNI